MPQQIANFKSEFLRLSRTARWGGFLKIKLVCDMPIMMRRGILCAL
jgi:hypothetical protein